MLTHPFTRDRKTVPTTDGCSHVTDGSQPEIKARLGAYNRTAHQGSLESSVEVIVGLPLVGTFEGSQTVLYKIAA